jgi:HAD superfamily hydrolase (TIGR01458 family)
MDAHSLRSRPMAIHAILFDIEGTLTDRGQAIPGAAAVVAHVRAQGIAVRFLTNITAQTPAHIATNLRLLGFAVEESEVQTATTVCVDVLKARTGVRCHLLVPDGVLPMFDGVARNDASPDVVVISDIGEGFTFAVLNHAFRLLRAGAELVALQKNLYWFAEDGARLDCGPFVLALEAASGKAATVTGKPSPVFFETALAGLACGRDEVLVVGDDLRTDIAGGRRAGLSTVLVGTGKYADGQQARVDGGEDHFLASVADLPALLARLA